MNENSLFDQELLERLTFMVGKGASNAAHGFSGMIGRTIYVVNPTAKVVPILTIPEIAGQPDGDAVGVYLCFNGDVKGQILMIVPFARAMELVDLLMALPTGTTQHLGSMEKSALGELGNLCGSFFLNAIAGITQAKFHPTPPAVMVDMVGAILDVVVATTGGVSERALLVQANFVDGSRCVDADFWVIPDMNALKDLLNKNTQ